MRVTLLPDEIIIDDMKMRKIFCIWLGYSVYEEDENEVPLVSTILQGGSRILLFTLIITLMRSQLRLT